MIAGVNFQPGQPTAGTPVRPKTGNSVQEAIKILSLRLPKQVGPNATAPAALLNAQGSGGNTRVDSVVNTVLGRYLPGGAGAGQAPPSAPMIPTGAGSTFSPGSNGTPPPNMPLADFFPSIARAPRITPADAPGQRIDVVPPARPAPEPAPGFQPQPTLPTYDREEGWGAAPVAPPAPTQDPWADLMEYLRRQPAPPQEPYSI